MVKFCRQPVKAFNGLTDERSRVFAGIIVKPVQLVVISGQLSF